MSPLANGVGALHIVIKQLDLFYEPVLKNETPLLQKKWCQKWHTSFKELLTFDHLSIK